MIEAFIQSLKNAPASQRIFNPWYDFDSENEASHEGAKIRRKHLQLYFEQRRQSARYLIIAEAVGYQGAHFSGIAMTSERILLGHQHHNNILPSYVFKHHLPQQTSQPQRWPQGFTEPTATIVWRSLLEFGLDPYSFVLWNAVPWHPYNPQHPKNQLSNRSPTSLEMEHSKPFLQAFLKLFPQGQPLAIGKKSVAMLESMGVTCPAVRHPAHGGASRFRVQMLDFLQKEGGGGRQECGRQRRGRHF